MIDQSPQSNSAVFTRRVETISSVVVLVALNISQPVLPVNVIERLLHRLTVKSHYDIVDDNMNEKYDNRFTRRIEMKTSFSVTNEDGTLNHVSAAGPTLFGWRKNELCGGLLSTASYVSQLHETVAETDNKLIRSDQMDAEDFTLVQLLVVDQF